MERDACYGPVMRDLGARFGDLASSSSAKVLVPGAGLGRLVFDLALAGFEAEGNELSYHQLFTSGYILNHTTSPNQHRLFPFAHTFSNHHNRADQMQAVSIPDIHPGSCQPLKGSMSMTTGDFIDVYQGEEYEDHFDAVATVFFVDTAPNFLAYVETVKRCLKQGGWWINVGPLLWHFGEKEKEKGKSSDEDVADDSSVEEAMDHEAQQATDETKTKQTRIGSSGGSIQLTDEEVVKILQISGFEIEVHETSALSTGYVQNSRSMLLNSYRPSHWVARKL